MDQIIAPGKVYFIGAGPGDLDLLTLKGRSVLEKADLILYADSLVNEEIRKLAKPEAVMIGTSNLNLDQLAAKMIATAREGKTIARVHSGDPSIYSAIHEQIVRISDAGITYEIVPGVSSVFAAASRLGIELTIPEVTQTLILTRAPGRTPMPIGEALKGLAAHRATMAIFLSASLIKKVVTELMEGGYPPDTPVAVLHRVTWSDEQVLQGTLSDITDKVIKAGFKKQALILVGPALDANLRTHTETSASNLYDKYFTHMFRKGETPQRRGTAIVARTRQGAELGARLRESLSESQLYVPAKFQEFSQAIGYDGSVLPLLRSLFFQKSGLVLCLPIGIAVRALGRLAADKHTDPAVVVVDEQGKFAISLLAGHLGGANRLAHTVGSILRAQPVITTGAEVNETLAVDMLGAEFGWVIANPAAVTTVSSAVINGANVGIYQEAGEDTWWPAIKSLPSNLTVVTSARELLDEQYHAGILVTHRSLESFSPELLAKLVVFHPKCLVVGIGCSRGVSAAEIETAVRNVLKQNNLAFDSVRNLASIEIKAEEPGLVEFARSHRLPVNIFSANQLNEMKTIPNPSDEVLKHVGVSGVAEPAAMLSAQANRLIVEKVKCGQVTVAVAQVNKASRTSKKGTLYLVGIGPGNKDHLTLKAEKALNDSDIIIGYSGYLGLIHPKPGQRVISSEIKEEVDRAKTAVALASSGKVVSLISSGDVGIYGMAGIAYEVLINQGWEPGNNPNVEVIPGVTAASAAASLLGAPLMNDFVSISLSDLLTPWERIANRLEVASQGDFVICLYNPCSQRRRKQIEEAQTILLKYRSSNTPVGIVANAYREEQSVVVTTLGEMLNHAINMLTILVIGNSQTFVLNGRMVTRRGYETECSSTLQS